MKYDDLLKIFSNRPFFETADLLTLFPEEESQILPRLSRWVAAGKLVRLRRGKYLLPLHYQTRAPHPFHISNFLYSPSYISLHTALEYYKLIPEHTLLIQAVSTRDTRHWDTPLGSFHYHSLKTNRFSGYKLIQLGINSQEMALIASPEKALVDICLLNSGEWDLKRWDGLRLQHTESLDPKILTEHTKDISSRKLARGIGALIQYLLEAK